MELKPGYKQTEVGVIPEDWDAKMLGEGVKLLSGQHVMAPDCNTDGKGVPYITGPADFQGGVIRHSKFTEKPTTICRANDILVTVKGSGAGTMVLSDGEYCISRQLMAVRVPDWDTKYIYCSLLQDASLIGAAATGLIPGLSRGDILGKQLAVPSVPEQRAIAAALSDVDALISSLDQLIAKKRDIKQATMQQLLTGKQRLPGFSGEWEVKCFGELASPRRERIDPKRTGTHDFCVELEHIESGTGKLAGHGATSDESSLKTVFRKDDVLFGKLRAYLRKYWLADRPGVCSTEIWALAANERLVRPEYLLQLVKVDRFIDVASTAYGTHMPRSDWNVVRSFEVALPKEEEQTAIASVLSDMDAQIAVLEQKRDKTLALKQGMMQVLLTGKIRLI